MSPGDSPSVHPFELYGPVVQALETSVNSPQEPSNSSPRVSGMAVASAFHGAHSFKIGGNPNFTSVGKQKNVTINNYAMANELGALKGFVSFSALHDSSAQDPERRCHPGTRENVLKQMRDWIDDTSSPKPILWLHGPAGVGKSAIAQTISQSYDRDKIVATFFFFRSDPSRNDGNQLFPTLAWQLAKTIPGLKDRIIHALTEDCDLPRKAIEIQFERLVAQPLREIVEASSRVQASSYVVVIDGVDECSEEKLQRRFLKVIGTTVADSSFPLRFLISSRPEAHIQETFAQFQCPTLYVDLANIDGWYRDIEKYLKEEFSRISSEQHLDSTWPGERTIQEFVDKSSGQFVYASTVARFVGDEYGSATSQLDIIMGLKPSEGESPFAYLDALYMEILQRQHHQKFLKEFLSLLVGRTSVQGIDDLGRDDAVLLGVDENELCRKLRGMHSLLKFKPHIGLHHRSFFDFLGESSRSLQYHVSQRRGTRRYLELITDVLIRYASKLIKRPDYHEAEHFNPAFGRVIRSLEARITLPIQDWEEVLHSIYSMKDNLLKLPDFSSPWKRGLCPHCTVFYLIDDLILHLEIFRATSHPIPSLLQRQLETLDVSSVLLHDASSRAHETHGPELREQREKKDLPALSVTKCVQDLLEDGLDATLSSLFGNFRDMDSRKPMCRSTIYLIYALLHFDPAETALKICSVLEAKHLVDVIFYLINKQQVHRSGLISIRNATQLGREIFSRVPLAPQVNLNEADLILHTPGFAPGSGTGKYKGEEVAIWNCSMSQVTVTYQGVFLWGLLSHKNVCPLIGIYTKESKLYCVYRKGGDRTLRDLQGSSRMDLPVAKLTECVLGVAEAIQYMHSFSVLSNGIYAESILVDANMNAKLHGYCLSMRFCTETPTDLSEPFWHYESNVYTFGCLLYEVYANVEMSLDDRLAFRKGIVMNHPHRREIPHFVTKLIQWCCAADPKNRPTMGEVVQELKSWNF